MRQKRRNQAFLSIALAAASGVFLLNMVGQLQSGNVSVVPLFIIAFVVFGIFAPMAVYRYNRYRNTTHESAEEMAEREQLIHNARMESNNDQEKTTD